MIYKSKRITVMFNNLIFAFSETLKDMFSVEEDNVLDSYELDKILFDKYDSTDVEENLELKNQE